MNFNDLASLALCIAAVYLAYDNWRLRVRITACHKMMAMLAVPIAGHPIRLACTSLQVVLGAFSGIGPHGDYTELMKKLEATKDQVATELRGAK